MKTKQFILLSCFCLFLLSCVSETKITDQIQLDVIPYNGTEMDVDKYISFEDTTILYVSDNVVSSNMEDACVDDSTIYILDKQNNIMAFDSKTGSMKCSINNVGHGRGEYIRPKSICVSDGRLYVLDRSGRGILQYDENLRFIKKIKFDNYLILDFIKIDGGFVLYNIAPNKDVKTIVVMDENGVVKNSYSFNPEEFPEKILTDKLFVRTDRGIFFMDIISNTLYELHGDDIYPVVGIEERNSNNNDYKLFRSFPLTNTILTFYLSENKMMGNIYDKKTRKSTSGRFKYHNSRALIPYIDKDGFLYRIKDGNNQYILVKYKFEI